MNNLFTSWIFSGKGLSSSDEQQSSKSTLLNYHSTQNHSLASSELHNASFLSFEDNNSSLASSKATIPSLASSERNLSTEDRNSSILSSKDRNSSMLSSEDPTSFIPSSEDYNSSMLSSEDHSSSASNSENHIHSSSFPLTELHKNISVPSSENDSTSLKSSENHSSTLIVNRLSLTSSTDNPRTFFSNDSTTIHSNISRLSSMITIDEPLTIDITNEVSATPTVLNASDNMIPDRREDDKNLTNGKLQLLENRIETVLRRLESEKTNFKTVALFDQCAVCLENRPTVRTLPCQHCALCTLCFVRLIQRAAVQLPRPSGTTQSQNMTRCVLCRAAVERATIV